MRVLNEFETVKRILGGCSVARFGDGEIWLMSGGLARFQKQDKNLRNELWSILDCKEPTCLRCLPRAVGPNSVYWKEFLFLLSEPPIYVGSTFISRPDEAPWTDNEIYRRNLALVWENRNVTLVGAFDLAPALKTASDITLIEAPATDAYDQIDELEEKIGLPDLAVLCLGATATCLASRLSKKGVQALDLGHLGKFMCDG